MELPLIHVHISLHRNITTCDLFIKQGMLLYVQYLLIMMPCVTSMMAFENKSIPEGEYCLNYILCHASVESIIIVKYKRLIISHNW